METVEGQALALNNLPAPLSIDQVVERYELIQSIVDKVMVKGRDFLVIPGTDKPTLVQPGAEKLCVTFRLTSEPECIEKIENWQEGFFFYRYKVAIRNQVTGVVVGWGEGSCNSRERRYRNQDVYSVANTILKMAIKRAFIAAVIKATGVSNLFTQDIEEPEDLGPQKTQAKPTPVKAATPAPTPAPSKTLIDRLTIARDALGWTKDQLGAWIQKNYSGGYLNLSKEKQAEVVDALEALAVAQIEEVPA